MGQRQRRAEQPGGIRVGAPAQLVQHGDAAQPEVFMAQRAIHVRMAVAAALEFRLQHLADDARHAVDAVPPRALARQAEQGGEVGDVQLATVQRQHVERHVLVFAFRLLPQQLRVLEQGRGIDALQARQQVPGGQPPLRRRHTQENELVAHIGLHGRRTGRFGYRFQRGFQCCM
ncbi:hypothetical protein D3C81_1675900 [compost metagenome]